MKVLCGRDDEKRRDESFDFLDRKNFEGRMSEKDEREKKKISLYTIIKSETSKSTQNTL